MTEGQSEGQLDDAVLVRIDEKLKKVLDKGVTASNALGLNLSRSQIMRAGGLRYARALIRKVKREVKDLEP